MSDNSYISSVFKSIGIMINEETKQEILYFFPLYIIKKIQHIILKIHIQ